MIRSVVSSSQIMYITYVVQNNLLEPIVKLFVSNGSKYENLMFSLQFYYLCKDALIIILRYNLINSAVIELFETIRKVLFTSLIF